MQKKNQFLKIYIWRVIIIITDIIGGFLYMHNNGLKNELETNKELNEQRFINLPFYNVFLWR